MKKIPFSQVSKYREHNQEKLSKLLPKSFSDLFRSLPKNWHLYMAVGKEWYRSDAFSLLSQTLPQSVISHLSEKFLTGKSHLTPTALALATKKTAVFMLCSYNEKRKRIEPDFYTGEGWATAGNVYPEKHGFKHPLKTYIPPFLHLLKEVDKNGVPPLVQFLRDVSFSYEPSLPGGEPKIWCANFYHRIVIKFKDSVDFQNELREVEDKKRQALTQMYFEVYGDESIYTLPPAKAKKKLKEMEDDFELEECDLYHIVAEAEVPDPAWAWFKEHFIPVLL